MKRWIVFVELTDRDPHDDVPEYALTEARVREIIDLLGPELPARISYKIRSVAGPFEVREARSDNG